MIKNKIYIEDLIPLLKRGWVAMNKDGCWWWYEDKPYIDDKDDFWTNTNHICGLFCLNIESVNDWTQSLREIK